MKNCPFWLPMKLLFKPTDPRYSVFHKILSAKDMPRLFMGSTIYKAFAIRLR